ncbi:hypothetical protein ATS72_000240 [Pseudoalteromonas sp. 13-15]|uniref:GNAT family N-acetyltransferase n=1 Tax=Pseudoalteromonas TaxID=53246 RepID=UPI000731BDB7|nr:MULTISPECIES: GNAT family N-acetyltransferase [Pseudoalteromonas]AUL72143.1 hypothetical protein ATS72_000240 [Pseudoalteromonas sp. 13-15]
MKVDLDEINSLLDELPKSKQHPMLRPEYVIAMSNENANAQAEFFLYKENNAFYYHPFILTRTIVSSVIINDIESAYGFGGPISSSADVKFLHRANDAYNAYIEKRDICAEFIRFSPVLKNSAYFVGDVEFNRNVVVVDLQDEDYMSNIQPRTRSAIRKSKRQGIDIKNNKSDVCIESFIALYDTTMKRLSADDFYLFKPDTIRKLINLQSCTLITAHYEGVIIAAATFFHEGNVMEYHLSASSEVGFKLNATKAIIANAMGSAYEKGCKYLHLGGGLTGSETDSLFLFKSLFSKTKSEYLIGKKIYKKKFYENQKRELITSGIVNAADNRLIFYR